MDSESRFVVTPRTVLGMSIALLGVLLTLDRLGFSDIDHLFRRFWPVPIMLMGGLMLVQANDGRERTRGAIFAIIGTWLFLNMQGWVNVRFWELFWPVILILVGISMAMRAGPRRRPFGPDGPLGPNGPLGPDGPLGASGPLGPDGPLGPKGPFGSEGPAGADGPLGTSRRFREPAGQASYFGGPADSSSRLSMFAIFSGARRAIRSQAFEGGDITAIMGGAILDLRLATIPAGREAALDVTAVMGGVQIFVPPHWEVATPIIPFMGGVEDTRLPPIQNEANSRAASGRLVIRGFTLMGGVHIKS